jgi:hypothetical protein
MLIGLGLVVWPLDGQVSQHVERTFSAEVERLSEPAGFFDTDNLISNERSYLEVIPTLIAGGVSGGAYIGVGPDQNFSYIAHIRPSVAYIIDVRRDNLLLHLLFKAVFAQAANRVEYLSLLTGRSPPKDPTHWVSSSLDQIVAYIDRSALSTGFLDTRSQLDRTIDGFGVPLSPGDHQTIDRFRRIFVDEGLNLRFKSHGRAPRPHYPTLRDLLLATDREGRQRHYLASEDDFQFVRSLQARDAVIPVVGDVAGPSALSAIGAAVADRQEEVTAFYISNVEFYLSEGRYEQFINNMSGLPLAPQGVMIRSIFGGGGSRTMVALLNELVR